MMKDLGALHASMAGRGSGPSNGRRANGHSHRQTKEKEVKKEDSDSSNEQDDMLVDETGQDAGRHTSGLLFIQSWSNHPLTRIQILHPLHH